MGLLSNFSKSPSSSGSTYDGQEGTNKGVISSIYRNIEDQDELVHRFPYNNISTSSVLTVQTGQMACFYVNGGLADTFFSDGERKILTTANIPGIRRILNLPSAGETTFQATVYFVNLMEKRNTLWGTGGMRIIDPYFDIPIKINSRGQFGFKIIDGPKFIEYFVSTLHDTTTDKIYEQFKSDIVTETKVSISKYMKNNNLNINDLSSEYREIANFIKENLFETFDKYGVELGNFNIEGIDFDEEDPGYIKVMDGIAERKRYNQMGDFYDKQRQYDIMETAAANEGAGTLMGAGMGLGMGVGMGNTMGSMMQQNMGNMGNIGQGQQQNMGNTGQQNNAPTAPPAPPTSQSFYMAQNGQTVGPFSIDQIQQGVASGQVTKQTHFCAVGSQAWLFAEQIGTINALFNSPPPPPPPPTQNL